MVKDYKKKSIQRFAEGGTVRREYWKDWANNLKANIENPRNSQFVLPKFGNQPGNDARRSRGQAMATMLFGFLPQKKAPK